MRVHCIIHAAFEKPGAIADWIAQKGFSLTETHTYRNEKLPSVTEFDFLIVMGGPQSPLKIEKWPYLVDEISLIQQAHRANKAILGICLGAQLIAESFGAKTQQSPQREIGVFPIELLPDAKDDPLFCQFPHTFPVTHWHNDMPGIPKEGRLLAKSKGCPQQAFSVGDRIYGLQFHLEITSRNIQDMLAHCKHELSADTYVESEEQLLKHNLDDINKKMFTVLDYLASRLT